MSQKKIGRYEILREIGRGGMATVYLAFDPVLEREVALKVLPTYFAHEAEFSARFEQEAKTIAALEHRCIVSMYDYGEDGDWPYFVMRFMPGGNLKERVVRGPLPVSEAARILQRVASALDKAHSRGIVHRDIKPANILFDEDGEAFLCDFGIVKLAAGSAAYTQTGNILGTPAYMSPEQARAVDKLDGRSDIYSLGVVLYEMLTGKIPYVADTTLGQAMMHVLEPVPDVLAANADLPPACRDIIHKAMAKQKEERYGSAAALAAAVQAVADGAVSPSMPEEKVTGETAVSPTPGKPTPAQSPPKVAPQPETRHVAQEPEPVPIPDHTPPVIQTSQATVMPKPTFPASPPVERPAFVREPAYAPVPVSQPNFLQRWWRAGLLFLALLLTFLGMHSWLVTLIITLPFVIVGVVDWNKQRKLRGTLLLLLALYWVISFMNQMGSIYFDSLYLPSWRIFAFGLTLLALLWTIVDGARGVPGSKTAQAFAQQDVRIDLATDWAINWFVFLILAVLAAGLGFGAAVFFANGLCSSCDHNTQNIGAWVIWIGGALLLFGIAVRRTRDWRHARARKRIANR